VILLICGTMTAHPIGLPQEKTVSSDTPPPGSMSTVGVPSPAHL
jgi:hypothetical protein